MNAKDKIEELALKVAMEALGSDVSPEDRREALKILNPHYTMLLKSKAKDEPPPTGGFDFDAFNLESEHAGKVGYNAVKLEPGTQVGGDRGTARGGRVLPS